MMGISEFSYMQCQHMLLKPFPLCNCLDERAVMKCVGKVQCKCHYLPSRAQGPTFCYMELYDDGGMQLISSKRCSRQPYSDRSKTTADRHVECKCRYQMQIQHFMYVNCRYEKFTIKHCVSRRLRTIVIMMLQAWGWEVLAHPPYSLDLSHIIIICSFK
jgi:hypothetical protein